jgi:hypothetical protein
MKSNGSALLLLFGQLFIAVSITQQVAEKLFSVTSITP